jgi:uncharacterized repeat protein (TIGR01451 family)
MAGFAIRGSPKANARRAEKYNVKLGNQRRLCLNTRGVIKNLKTLKMFEKLLAILPYNPSLASQLSFYGRRMHEEAVIRRTGLFFLVLTFMIQFFAVLSPPQPTVASSSNDLINGGFSSAADAKAQCLRDTQGYQHILHYYGISCAAFDGAQTLTIHSDADSNQYFSMGHNPTGSAGETPVTIDGAGTLYWRHLSVFGSVAYQVLRLTNNQGKTFYAMYTCGNLVSVGVPSASPLTPPAPPPTPTPTPPTPTPTPPAPAPPTPTPTPTPPTPAAVCQYNPAIPATSAQCFQPCQYNSQIPATDNACKPCDKSSTSQDALACVAVHKTASNVTANITDANGTTANPGDTIVYTLYAQNTGKATVKGYVFQENLNDVLDYADVTDMHGGTLGSNGLASWPAQDIQASQTVTVQITVKVKNPVPQTPTSTSDPAHFDLTMTNVYGNTINIKVPPSITKTIETATTTTLPNTGPGTSLFIAATIVMVAGYFYGRARLLAKESSLAIQQNVGS